MKKKRFYQIEQTGKNADINIYGDITAWEWFDSDVSAHSLKTEIDALDVDKINVYINSLGGEVAEALAICSALKRHKAKIHTYVDGFACSAASMIFCAGDERTMGTGTLLMIHNCMSYAGYANSEELRQLAEVNDKVNEASIGYYKSVSKLSEAEVKELMDNEAWLTAGECLQFGFATDITDDEVKDGEPTQSAFAIIRNAVLHKDDLQKTVKQSMQEVINGLLEKMKQDDTNPGEENETDENEKPENDTDDDQTADEEEPADETDETSDDDPNGDDKPLEKAIAFFKQLSKNI